MEVRAGIAPASPALQAGVSTARPTDRRRAVVSIHTLSGHRVSNPRRPPGRFTLRGGGQPNRTVGSSPARLSSPVGHHCPLPSYSYSYAYSYSHRSTSASGNAPPRVALGSGGYRPPVLAVELGAPVEGPAGIEPAPTGPHPVMRDHYTTVPGPGSGNCTRSSTLARSRAAVTPCPEWSPRPESNRHFDVRSVA